jgi:hypothetical protein
MLISLFDKIEVLSGNKQILKALQLFHIHNVSLQIFARIRFQSYAKYVPVIF